MSRFADFFLHASDEEKIRVFTEAANLANQEQRRYMNEELSHCCKAPKKVSHADEGTAFYICSNCKQEFLTQEQWEAIPPTDGEIVADGKAQVLLADIDPYIQGQIDAYTDIFEHASGGGDFRRLCIQRVAKLKGE